jgi:hypothetical protein
MATTTPSRTGESEAEVAGTTASPPAPAASAPETREWLQQRIPGAMAGVVGVSWYALFAIGTAVEPETSHAVPVIGVVLGAALLGAMLATAIGLAMCRRWGLVAALGASVLLLASAVACPTTGHHTIGAWWYLQMACSFAAVGVSVVALRRSVTAEL